MSLPAFKHLSFRPEIHVADGIAFYLCDYTKTPIKDGVGLPDFLCKKGGVKKNLQMRGRFADWNVLWRFLLDARGDDLLSQEDFARVFDWLKEHANSHNNQDKGRRFQDAPARHELQLFGGQWTTDQYFASYDRFTVGSVSANIEIAIRETEKSERETEAAKQERPIITQLPLSQLHIPTESTSLHIIEFAVVPCMKTAMVRQTSAHDNKELGEILPKHLARVMGINKLGIHFCKETSDWVSQRPTTYTKAQNAQLESYKEAAVTLSAEPKEESKKRKPAEKQRITVPSAPGNGPEVKAPFKKRTKKKAATAEEITERAIDAALNLNLE